MASGRNPVNALVSTTILEAYNPAAHPAITCDCTAAILTACPPDERAAPPPATRSSPGTRERGRPLAFRRTRDPYAILVSEAMAQQTQAARAAAYWERFMERFPTVEALAAATPGGRPPRMAGTWLRPPGPGALAAARIVVDEHGGQVPSTVTELEALPGIGPYTARAVAALAFGVPVGAVDVNVRRVLGRIVAGDAADAVGAGAPVGRRRVGSTPTGQAEWTHAVMDIGATLCRPRAPRCEACPARPWCRLASKRAARSAATPGTVSERRPRARRARSRRRIAGFVAGSSTGCARRRTASGSRSTRRSAPTTRRACAPRPTRWPPTASSSSRRPRADDDRLHSQTAAGLTRQPGWATLGRPCHRPPCPAGDRRSGTAAPDAHDAAPLPANDPELFEMDLRGLRARWADRAAMPAIGAEAMTGADRRAQALGVSEERLMEHAGTAVAAAVRALAVDTGRWGTGPIVILCGPGNNGGDGFVAARRLALAGGAGRGRGRRDRGETPGSGRVPQLGPDRARHRHRQGPRPGRPRRRGLRPGHRACRRHRRRAARDRRPRPASRPDPDRGRAHRARAGRAASRSWPSTRPPRSTSRAASPRSRPSGPT